MYNYCAYFYNVSSIIICVINISVLGSKIYMDVTLKILFAGWNVLKSSECLETLYNFFYIG